MRIIIVDDDHLGAEALRTILEAQEGFEVSAVGNDGKEAVALYRKLRPDLLLMDIRMKEMNGLEASALILQEFPEARILLLTTFSDDDYIIKALQLGARGYLLKQNYGSLIPAINAVNSGQTVFGDEIVSKIPALIQENGDFDYKQHEINDREYEIIKLVAEGLSNKEIAGELFLSEGTVRNYISSVLDKLELRDRTQLAVFYYQHK